MAEANVEEITEQIQTPESGLKCRQCRSGFVAEIYDCDGEFASTDDLFVFDDDSMPDWIAVKVEEAGWTKGKLNCPKPNCEAKLGGFDFVAGAAYPVHIVKSKVDLWIKPKPASSTMSVADATLQSSKEDFQLLLQSSPSIVTNSSLSDSADSTTSTSPTTSASWSTNSNLSTSPETEDSSDDDNERQESRKKLRRRRRKKRRLHRVVAKKDFIEKKKLQLLEQIMTAEPELDDLDSSLMCPVCLDLLFDPYGVIPCKHTFCETCLRRIGSKDPMNTFCPMCRQRIVYCEVQPDLAMSIRESYPDLYKKRKTAEKSTNVYNLPLPWRPGWRNLVSGRALGGNPIGASTFFDYLRTIVQLLPYYIPPVVIANLINMVFFFFLLGAVEFFPMMTGLFQRTTRTNPIFTKQTSSVVETTELETSSTDGLGVSPYSFLEVFLHQSPALVKKSWISPATGQSSSDEISLPPTYMPPESTTTTMDATFYYVIGGMTLMAAAFGNLIILNFEF